MKRNRLGYGAVFAAIATPAFADELIISIDTLGPVATATAQGSTPGNITIESSTVLSVSASGAVATLNSNNTILNSGTIETTAGSNAVGVHILGGFTGSFQQDVNSVISVVGAGTNNVGILLDGPGAFTGDITLSETSIIGIHGANSVGVDIQAPLNGNLTVSSISGFGVGNRGVVVTAPINGTFTNNGFILLLSFLDQSLYTVTNVDPVTGGGVVVGASISGGIVNVGPVDIFDTGSSTASIQVSTTVPAILIAPSVAGAAATDIVIGPDSADTTNPTFSFINRGVIANKQNDTSLSTTAVRIGEDAPGMPAHTTTLSGGFFNRGTIQGEARSDNLFSSNVAAVPTNSTGLEIGNGAILHGFSYAQAAGSGSTTATIVLDAGASPTDNFYKGLIVKWNGQDRLITAYDGASRTATIGALNGSSAIWATAPQPSDSFTIRSAALVNDGQILACQPQCGTITVNGPENGIITALLIQPFAYLPSLSNTGSIASQAVSSSAAVSGLTAYGIRDLSGTLSDITNSGSIQASATPLADGSEKAVAIDLSAGSTNQTISNFGTVAGDIYFGTAGMNGAVAGNQLTIEGSTAGVHGNVRPTGSGTLDIHVSQQGTGGSFLTSNTRATTMDVGSAGQVFFVLNKTSLAAPIISTTGTATFATGALTAMLPGSFLANGTYTLVNAGAGNLHFDDTSSFDLTDPTKNSAFGIPFLYKASLATDANTTVTNNGTALKLTLTRKTAAELGISGNAAALYDPLAAAALGDDTFGVSLLGLSSVSQIQTTLESVVPDIAGGVRALAVAMTDQATGVIGARQRQLLTAPPGSREEFRFWAQEFYNNVRDDGSASSPGFGGAGQGMSFGGEWGSLNTGRYGVGLTFFSSQETEVHPRDTKTDGDWGMASAYAAWRFDNFFVAPQVNAGSGDMTSRRAIIAGNDIRSAYAKWNSYVVAGGLTGGYIFDVGQFQIIPTIALDGLYLSESAYSESYAGGVGLSLKSQSQKSARAFAGVIGQGKFTYDEGNLMPQLLAGWSHEFMNNPATIDGTFEAAPGSPFHLVGPTLEPNHIVGGMSLGYVLRNWSAGVNYDASANSGALAQSATISLTSRF